MQKIFFLLIFLVTTSSQLYSQDLIVTHDGDSITCEIDKVSDDYIYFSFEKESRLVNSVLPTSKVLSYSKDFYGKENIKHAVSFKNSDFQHYRISLNGGGGYQTARIHRDIPEKYHPFYKDLKSGYHIGADAHYYFTEPLGFGAVYCLFKTSAFMDHVIVYDRFGLRYTGTMSDDVRVSFIAPSFSMRLINQEKTNAFLCNIAIGYVAYKSEQSFMRDVTLTASTLGVSYHLGYDWGITDNLAVGFSAGAFLANIYQFKVDNGFISETVTLKSDEAEGLNRFDLSIGLRLNL